MFENLVISDKCKTQQQKKSFNDQFENLVISDKCKTKAALKKTESVV